MERALAREIAHLHAVTAQINHKASSIDKELENLEVAAATIEDNIRSGSCKINSTSLAFDVCQGQRFKCMCFDLKSVLKGCMLCTAHICMTGT